MKNLFFFEDMLTPKIITIIYWFLLAGAVIWVTVRIRAKMGNSVYAHSI